MKHGNRLYCCMLKILLFFVISGILHYFYHDISKYFKFSNCHAGLFPHLYSTRKSSSNYIYIYSAIFIYAILKIILFLATYFPSKNTCKISTHLGSTENSSFLFFSFVSWLLISLDSYCIENNYLPSTWRHSCWCQDASRSFAVPPPVKGCQGENTTCHPSFPRYIQF